MSVQAMSWALSQQTITDPTARHVLLCLANYADQDGVAAFPSATTLARDTGRSERTVRYKLDELEAAGVIEKGNQKIVEAYIDRADRRPICFNIRLPRGAATAPGKQRGASDAGTGCSQRRNGVQSVQERGAAAAPNPSDNPPNNPSIESEKKNAPGKAGLDTSVLPDDLSPQVWSDWLQQRKDMKAPVKTQTVVKSVAKELEKARKFGWSPDDAIAEAMNAGWRGFKADWLKNRQGPAPQNKNARPQAKHNNLTAKGDGFEPIEGDEMSLGI